MDEMKDQPRLQAIRLRAPKTTLRLDEPVFLWLSGRMSDGSETNFLGTRIAYTCSDPEVLSTVTRMGAGAFIRAGTRTDGEASVTVTVTDQDGETFTESILFTVIPEPARPFIHPYHQTLTMKITSCTPDGTVYSSFEQSLDVIRKLDHLTREIPKIIYLTGWQYDGHDTGYPAWDIVNPKLKRPQDETALESLQWLMEEAFAYNTTVSLHINMLDINPSSPMWDVYVERDLLARNADGSLKTYLWGHPISYTREWNAGFTQIRIDQLLEMLPLQKAGTIHIDAFHQLIPRLEHETISPYHGISLLEEAETQKKMFRYWRDKGVDVTSEFDHKYRMDPFLGLQPLAWHFGQLDPMRVPAALCVGGEGGDPRFGVSMLGQKIIKSDPGNLDGFLDEFCRKTLCWYYLNRLGRLSELDGVVTFTDGVTSYEENGKHIIRQGEIQIREGNDLFVPVLWNEHKYKEILAYSRDGYVNRVWKLPEPWRSIDAADLYSVSVQGVKLLEQNKIIHGGTISISLGKGQALSLVPTGTVI
ncbi:endo-alpha-N-acetylgalactosaminidase family protein [Paenibacillus sp. GD4]|uniref:endo-alpha-N-acetylgalactosaminidase family protein n=1 Tax=Paenibacillus sp. GD4 TaxID=3068890 RepID=UPI002796BB89|nr:endo-alpha-N-acetylgalactosaminidase family protein [Paenibacillus sp. GD4]MDQ1912596.1 endo-alpha-N-acetylgalactosaminidase family protein [Paenibacillus sp. GD4]